MRVWSGGSTGRQNVGCEGHSTTQPSPSGGARSSQKARSRARAVPSAIALALAILLGACGEPSPEAQLADARQQLERARQEVASAEARHQDAQRKLERAREARDQAAEALRRAKAELARARKEVGRFATDDAIFRSVQKRMLEDEKLSEVAIPVRVEKGVVVLTGTVPEKSLAKRAEELAREASGVIEVRNRIEVRSGPPTGAKEEAKADDSRAGQGAETGSGAKHPGQEE